jgi:hypothetical protein
MDLPNLAHRLHHRNGVGRRRHGRRIESVEQPEPIRADLEASASRFSRLLGKRLSSTRWP